MNSGFEIDWGKQTLIPEGEYEAVYVSHQTTNGSFGPKVKITFRVTSMGEQYETLIDAWYNAKETGKKTRKGGQVKLSRHSKLTIELLRVLHIKRRIDRLTPALLKGHIAIIKVRSVKTNHLQKELPEVLHYSVVESIVRLISHQNISGVPVLVPELTPQPVPTSKGTERHPNYV